MKWSFFFFFFLTLSTGKDVINLASHRVEGMQMGISRKGNCFEMSQTHRLRNSMSGTLPPQNTLYHLVHTDISCRDKPPQKHSGFGVPLWLSSNKPNWYPRGYRFVPWPRSVGWGAGVALGCGVGCRHGSDPALLWLWRRPAAAGPIGPLAWERPCQKSAQWF